MRGVVRALVSVCVVGMAVVAGWGVLGQDEALRSGSEAGSRAVTQRFAGNGRWRSARGQGEERPWHIHAVRREDDSVRAKLGVPGVAGMAAVTVEGQLDGREAFGVLLDGEGRQLAAFNATLFADGKGGTFILDNGESGTWGYDGGGQVLAADGQR